MTLSYQARRVVDPGAPNAIADCVAGRYVISEVLDDLLAVADDALLVNEESIKEGMRLLYLRSGPVVEPAAALGVAAFLEAPRRYAGKTVATVPLRRQCRAEGLRSVSQEIVNAGFRPQAVVASTSARSI